MNDQELRQARKQYKSRVKINQEIKELEETKEVLRYLEILNMSKKQKTPEEILIEIFSNIGTKTKDSNNIYVFMGSYYQYKKENSTTAILLIKNDPLSNYNEYWDLETEKSIHIPKTEIKQFEENNIIIDNKVPKFSTSFRNYHENFYKIQSKYYQILTYNTKENALTRIKKIYN